MLDTLLHAVVSMPAPEQRQLCLPVTCSELARRLLGADSPSLHAARLCMSRYPIYFYKSPPPNSKVWLRVEEAAAALQAKQTGTASSNAAAATSESVQRVAAAACEARRPFMDKILLLAGE